MGSFASDSSSVTAVMIPPTHMSMHVHSHIHRDREKGGDIERNILFLIAPKGKIRLKVLHFKSGLSLCCSGLGSPTRLCPWGWVLLKQPEAAQFDHFPSLFKDRLVPAQSTRFLHAD